MHRQLFFLKEWFFMKPMLRVFSLLLALVLLVGPAPSAFAEDNASGLDALMEKFDERVLRPKESSVLAEPEKMIVVAPYRNYICALTQTGRGLILSQVPEGASVTVYARQNGWALGLTEDGAIGGWMNGNFLEKAPAEGEAPSPRLVMASVMSHFPLNVQVPKQSSLLDEPVRMKIESTYGRCIYVMPNIFDNKEEELKTAPEGAIVTVYAVENNYVLGVVEGSKVAGWMCAGKLVPEDDEASGNGKERETRIDELMQGFSSLVQRPKKASLLDEPVEMRVRGIRSRMVYVMARVANIRIGEAPDGESVTVYARQNGWALVKSADGTIGGWINEKFLVS